MTYHTRIDGAAPSISCNQGNINVPYVNRPNCMAHVTWNAATATDNCTASPTIRYDIDFGDNGSIDVTDQVGTTADFPVGVSKVIAKATDECGNQSTCFFLVTVSNAAQVDVQVQLSPTIVAGPLTRCISFDFLDCTASTTVSVDADIVFVGGASAVTTLTISPCASFSCAMARDKLHTLRRSTTMTFNVGTGRYEAGWTGNVNLGGDWLVGGNLNDDLYIDILDFGIWAGLYLTNYGTGDTPCPVTNPPRHADINGDGLVDMADFTFIMLNFLQFREPNCCTGDPFADQQNSQPVLSISVDELIRRGEYWMALSDLNRDGYVDMFDIIWAATNGIHPPVRALAEVDQAVPDPVDPKAAFDIDP